MSGHDELIAAYVLGDLEGDDLKRAEELIAADDSARRLAESMKATVSGLEDWKESHAATVRRARAPIGAATWMARAAVFVLMLAGAWAVMRPDITPDDESRTAVEDDVAGRLAWTDELFVQKSGKPGGVLRMGGGEGTGDAGDPGGTSGGTEGGSEIDTGGSLGGPPGGEQGGGGGGLQRGGNEPKRGGSGPKGGGDPDLSWFSSQFDFKFSLPHKIADGYEFEGGKSGPDNDAEKVALKYTKGRGEILVFLMPEAGEDHLPVTISRGGRRLTTARIRGLRIAIHAPDLDLSRIRALFGLFLPR